MVGLPAGPNDQQSNRVVGISGIQSLDVLRSANDVAAINQQHAANNAFR